MEGGESTTRPYAIGDTRVKFDWVRNSPLTRFKMCLKFFFDFLIKNNGLKVERHCSCTWRRWHREKIKKNSKRTWVNKALKQRKAIQVKSSCSIQNIFCITGVEREIHTLNEIKLSRLNSCQQLVIRLVTVGMSEGKRSKRRLSTEVG